MRGAADIHFAAIRQRDPRESASHSDFRATDQFGRVAFCFTLQTHLPFNCQVVAFDAPYNFRRGLRKYRLRCKHQEPDRGCSRELLC